MKLTRGNDNIGAVLDMRRFLLASSFALVAVVATSCGSDKQDAASDSIARDTPTVTVQPEVTSTYSPKVAAPTTSNPVAAQPSTSGTPVFWMRTDRTLKKSPGGYITVIVPTTPDYAGVNAIVKDVRAMKASEQGGWFVQIRCGTSMDDPGGTVIANAKFAFDNLGAAQTGLTKYGQDVDINPNASCG